MHENEPPHGKKGETKKRARLDTVYQQKFFGIPNRSGPVGCNSLEGPAAGVAPGAIAGDQASSRGSTFFLVRRRRRRGVPVARLGDLRHCRDELRVAFARQLLLPFKLLANRPKVSRQDLVHRIMMDFEQEQNDRY
jgi:hypothetical protein